MRLYFIVCFLTCLLAGACNKPRELPPVPFDEMGKVLLDIQLAETYSQGLGRDSSTSRFSKNYDSLELFYSAILKHHKLSFAKFNEAMSWYRQRPEQADSLFSLVLDNLHVLQSEFQIAAEKEHTGDDKTRPKADTLKTSPSLSRERDSADLHNDRDTVFRHQLPQSPELEALPHE